jgi:hypothetical protein
MFGRFTRLFVEHAGAKARDTQSELLAVEVTVLNDSQISTANSVNS